MSDGYHTFDELYEHRHALFIALCRLLVKDGRYVWRSQQHADGTMYPDWFIVGIDVEAGKQITYHLPINLWSKTHFMETLFRAPEWDGHTPNDVINRLMAGW